MNIPERKPAFLDNPEYQEYLQKAAAYDPGQVAFVNTVLGDETFANEQARNQVRDMLAYATNMNRGRDLGLRQEQIDAGQEMAQANMDLSGRERKFQRNQEKLENYLGLGKLAAGTGLGVLNFRNKKNQAGKIRSNTNRVYGG